MIKKEINFSDLIEFFKKNQIPVFDEDIDKFGGYFITAARLAAVIIAPDPISKIAVFCASIDAGSLRASKLFSWLPDKFKYKDKGRENIAIHRYELASYVNFILLQIAIKNGVKDVFMPHVKIILEDLVLDDDDKKELEKKCKEFDKERESFNFPLNCVLSKDDIASQSFKIIDPILSILIKNFDKCKETNTTLKKFDSTKTKEQFINNISIQYQAYLIHFSSEFPEFALWVDVTQKARILKELKEVTKTLQVQNKKEQELFIRQTERLLKKIDDLKDRSFIKESGFPTFIPIYKKMFKVQEQHLSKVLSGKIIDNITAHQNQIKRELTKPLSDNTDVENIIYPQNREIYISQSFESITYIKKEHKKGFLTAESLGEKAERGENIGNYLLQTLIDPNYASKPIILLGNPGAGKSMLSKMFAGLLCETNDFIPFLIKLRGVASSSSSISEHINKGLTNSIENVSDVNWLDWAKEFRERTPVIIMDGFDELVQTSNRELNGYVDSIREFQEKAIDNNVCVRIILTSRITVMQDVSIPEGSKIIKLDSFDKKRIDLWISKWNGVQKKLKYKFAIPKNDKIELLAKEPLLMFMLAVYDFENFELQLMVSDKSFNQSKLYDSLLNRFIKRQLEKSRLYKDAGKIQKEKEEELFRLRLGMIAIMMFMNDTTSRDTQKLLEEMAAFGIQKSNIQTENILAGFFFIHENKSTTESNVEKFNYEFLHKTFGEFLAADFMLRIASKQFERMLNNNQDIIAKKETFNFCYGYNWLNKHNNIQNFLFEHATQILKPNTQESRFVINNIIKTDLKELFDKGHQAFPVVEIRLMEKKSVIEHLGIYSQNLVFLWLAITDEKHLIKFDIFEPDEKIGETVYEPKYQSQDRDETNKNKLLWKRLAKLWSLVGNCSAAAKLNDWINISEIGNDIILKRIKSDVIHNFSNAANVACNDFELLLSYFDNEFKFSKEQHTLKIVEEIIKKKPELSFLAFDVILHRFHDLFSVEGLELFEWFKNKDISRRQQISFIKKIGLLKWQIEPAILNDVIQFISREMKFIFKDNIQSTIEYLKILVDIKTLFPVSPIFNPEILDEMLSRLTRDIGRFDRENPISTLEYIKLLNELNRIYPVRRKFKNDFLEEALHRLVMDMRHMVRDNPYTSYEYLKLLNELGKYFPVWKMLPPELFEESLYRISKDIKHIAHDNPHNILEYLKLVNDIFRNSPFHKKIPKEFFLESLKFINHDWAYLFKDNHYNLLEYLKILTDFSKYYPEEELIPHDLVRESFQKLSYDIVYIIRDNPREAQKYIKVLKQFQHYYPKDTLQNSRIFEESIHRMNKEFDFDFRGNTEIALIYLELLLMNYENFLPFYNDNIIDRILGQIYKRDQNNKLVLRAAILLIQYKAPLHLIERLLINFPKIKKLYSSSPDIAEEIIEATLELNDNEDIN